MCLRVRNKPIERVTKVSREIRYRCIVGECHQIPERPRGEACHVGERG